MLTDLQLQRYSRQLMLDAFDLEGQEKLKAARVLIVGLGGLGCPAAMYLAAAGVGTLILADHDEVELSNLQRQIAHCESDVGSNKAESARRSIVDLNSDTTVNTVTQRLADTELSELVTQVDLVVDATDNYPTRFALNRACIGARIALVSGSAVRTEGQVAVFQPARGGGCYRCLYPDAGAGAALSCSQSGVLSPVVGIVGAHLAMEAVKELADYGRTLRGRVMLLDLATTEVRVMALSARSDCPDCGGVGALP